MSALCRNFQRERDTKGDVLESNSESKTKLKRDTVSERQSKDGGEMEG